MAELFGFKFERIKDSKGSEKFTPPTSDDGTIDIEIFHNNQNVILQ